MSSAAFTQFQQAVETYRAQHREVQRTLETNRAQKAALEVEFERAVLEGGPLAPLRDRLTQLDAEYDLLNRQAAALANAEKSETLKALGEGVLTENSTHLQGLRFDFQAILQTLGTARRDYLRHVAQAGEVYRAGRTLSNEIAAVRESLHARGRPIEHVPGVGEDLNLPQMKGGIFFDPRDIRNAFEGGFKEP